MAMLSEDVSRGVANVDCEAADETSQMSEPLSCTTCRSRKLKCDKTSGTCARCFKAGAVCVYPESRRKPKFDRRNVKELEARLAHVEGFLKEAVNKGGENISPNIHQLLDEEEVSSDLHDVGSGRPMPSSEPGPDNQGFAQTFRGNEPRSAQPQGQLMSLGMNEALPPPEMIEDLTNLYFQNSHHLIPLLHTGRYYQSFYGAAAQKPPMCLQYAVWALGSHMDRKYGQYTDIFYQRARKYANEDEMKGEGEHIMTLAHAQTWALIASFEAKSVLFTRAAMSSARCVRLVNMMGLDRTDDVDNEMAPGLGPAKDWVELEERRRTFWGAFAIDAHAAISTGWPSLIDSEEIVNRLPASEDAFLAGREEAAAFMEDAFVGAEYAGFASTILLCQMSKDVVRHAHRSRPRDRPDDVMNGRFWKKHRELDNKLCSMFMFLPSRFHLPRHSRDPSAVHCNLNLHLTVICLHQAALEAVEKHKLPESIKATSLARLRQSGEEVGSIVRMTAHQPSLYKSPLCSLSMYSATTAYVYLAKESPEGLSSVDVSNVEIILRAMQAIGRSHKPTKSFLIHACEDIRVHGLSQVINLPDPDPGDELHNPGMCATIPLMIRSSVTRHTEISPVLPGRLPLANPMGRVPRLLGHDDTRFGGSFSWSVSNGGGLGTNSGLLGGSDVPSLEDEPRQKRKRVAASPAPGSHLVSEAPETSTRPLGANSYTQHRWLPDMQEQYKRMAPALSAVGLWRAGGVNPELDEPTLWFTLPDRTGASTDSSPAPNQSTASGTRSSISDTPPGIGLGNSAEENRMDLRALQDSIFSSATWTATQEGPALQGDISDCILQDALSGGLDPWDFITGEAN